jgi:ribonuclease HI
MKNKDFMEKAQEFLWKCTHDAFKIGKFWQNVTNYENRSTCVTCGIEESMEHILTECDAPGRETIWKIANDLWKKRSPNPIPTNYGTILGCGLSTSRKITEITINQTKA